MDEIRKQIIDKLIETEKVHNVKIVFAIESGSRGWGFESPDSDYDCRFVYVREKDSYITVQQKKDFIEYDVDKIFDINGWDLEKFLKHIIKSNATLLEWLKSNVIYMKNEQCTDILLNLGEDFFNPISVSYHYLSMAKKKFDIINSDECAIKTYFYVLRPLANLRYIYILNKIPLMEYFDTLKEINIQDEVVAEIKALYDLKVKVDERYKVDKNEVLINYFKKEIEFFEKEINNLKHVKNGDLSKCDEAFINIIERMWKDGQN